MNSKQTVKSICLVTLGCSKNRVDSEHLLRQVELYGINIIPDKFELDNGFTQNCDAIIINTCGFIKDAKVESINAVFAAINAKNNGLVKYVYVFGCLSQRYKNDLIKEIPEVDGFYGSFDTDSVLKAIGVEKNPFKLLERYVTTPKHYAYLKISEGCNRKCAYCSIPSIRGKHISVPIEDLVEEAKNLANKGVKELIVVAQDTTYYGLDLYKKRSLATLLEALCAIDGIEWIRLHYSYPANFPRNVLKVMASNPKICKYIDIPLQHSSTKVLSAMKRNINAEDTQKLIDDFRKTVDGLVIRTTMIVGHPQETKKDFDHLLSFVRNNKFERLGAFTYSHEEGTYGAKHYTDSIRESTKQKRLSLLMEVQAEISYNCNQSMVGREEKMIVDSYSDGILYARCSTQSPEVDGETHIKTSALALNINYDQLVGKFILVKIIGADEYDLQGEIIKIL